MSTKVLPTTFTLFESQNILNTSAEPLCISCSDENIFIACEGCILEVYNLSNREQIAKIRTIWPVNEVAYNKHGDCIVTVEARNFDSAARSRVYFNWRGIGDFNRPHRVVLLNSQQESIDAEIVELPVENCSCISTCELTGVIAVGSERIIRLFALSKETSVSLSTGGYKLVSLLSIRTDMKLRNVSICGNFIACTSTHRVRVLKFLIIGSNDHPWNEFQSKTEPLVTTELAKDCKKDANFFLWSPSRVWEMEATMASEIQHNVSNDASPLLSPSSSIKRADSISTLTVPAITQAITEARTDTGKYELEILGPVEYVWGQPLVVEMCDELQPKMKCRALTMLYRRFASTGYAYVHVASNEGSLPSRRSATLSTSSSTGNKHKGGVHSVQLVPTVTFKENGQKNLIGMSCVLANRTKGFMYDVFDKSKLITSLSFMTRSQRLYYDGHYFHALSGNAVDSYTTRSISSVISRQKLTSSVVGHTNWINQPCPLSNVMLTLISSNKFIGCCDLVASSSHNIVLCKMNDSSPLLQPPTSSFLESISIKRKKPAKGSWNIYILEKKPIIEMFHQFVDFAHNQSEGLPPVIQHHLSEAHILLRSLIIEDASVSTDVMNMLRDNCYELAQSLCEYSADKTATVAAGYFILSGRSIVDIINYIVTKYSQGNSKTPFEVLLKYLNMVLFEQNNQPQISTLHTYGDQVLELYTKYNCDRLPYFVLFSWLKGYSNDKAIELLKMLLPKVKTSTNTNTSGLNHNIINLAMCSIYCNTNQTSDAIELISLIDDDYLLSWTINNIHFVFDIENNNIQPLGQVIMKGRERVFLDFVSHLLTGDHLKWKSICEIMKVKDDKTLIENHTLKKLLENIVTGNVEIDHATISSAANILAELLTKIIISNGNNNTNNTSITTTCVQFGTRYRWLNKLPPFEGSAVDKYDILYTDTSQASLRNLIELQSLLCSTFMCSEMADIVDYTVANTNNYMTISIKLLIWPFLDKTNEAYSMLLQQYPLIVTEYCQIFCEFDLSKWKELLDMLSKLLESETSTMKRDQIEIVYKDSLKHIATLTSPEELFTLLPQNGNVLFFLPVLETSCKIYLAGNIMNRLQKTLQNNNND